MFIKIIKKIITVISEISSKTRIGRYINEIIVSSAMNQEKKISYNEIKMKYVVPNKLNYFRIDTFSTKEPETLEWISNIPQNSTIWDIGANIGLYSIYAAKLRDCNVIAFEPSVFNLEVLARNIFINKVNDKIKILPIALSDKMGSNIMRLTTTEWGGALSSFGENVGWDGNPIDEVFSFTTFGCSMDEAMSILNLPKPDYIKMDVDGIEHFILEGGEKVLKEVKGILIEINDDFIKQSDKSEQILLSSGLSLKDKRHSEMFDNSSFSTLFNQIWEREI